ncbi:MAG TPA: phasin family protein [Burkholderiales bacterium]|nr:phasin family protein [Burkholderiales bacterium]
MQAQSQFIDVYRSMTRAAIDSMKTTLQTSERFHQQQLQMLRGALEQNMKSAQQLAEVRSLDDLLSLQSQIAGAQVAQAMDAWRTIVRAASDTQLTAMAQMQTQVGQATDTVRQAYDLTARAAEDVTRMAASQVSAVGAAGAREAGSERREPQRKSA